MSDHLNAGPVLIAGCGNIASAYAKVLRALGVPFEAIGRGHASKAAFAAATGVAPLPGELSQALPDAASRCRSAIVAVSVDQLRPVTERLMEAGIRRILLEKPGGLYAADIAALAAAAARTGSEIFVAYNRRFYASTRRARELIAADGGATSFIFEFTEWAHLIAGEAHPAATKQEWFLVNSTHVCDLAFFLCGLPRSFSALSGGALDWHRSGARFVGCGVTERGAFFSYHSNWESAGRWGVEICTQKRRLFLRPLETLQEQLRGGVELRPVALDDALDRAFKPGFYEQARAFLSGEVSDLLPIAAQARIAAQVYSRIRSAVRQRLLVIGDSTVDARREVPYQDTWICRLKAAMPDTDVIVLADGGRTTDFLALHPVRGTDGSVGYHPFSLEAFDPHMVVLNLGIVDCAPRLFRRAESFFLERLPERLREWIISVARRLRRRNDRRAYVPPARFERNLRQYFERCEAAGVERLVVIGIISPDDRALERNPGLRGASSRYNAIYRELCRHFDFAVFIEPLRPKEAVSCLFIGDGYHPSSHGHSEVFRALASVLDLPRDRE